MSATVNVFSGLILYKPKLVAVAAALMLGQGHVALSVVLGNNFPVVDLELNGCLDETGVVLHHLGVVLLNIVVLDEIAHIVKTGGSNVGAGSFQRMR